MDILGESMWRVSGDVSFAEYRYERRVEIFRGYENKPENYTHVILLPRYSWWGLSQSKCWTLFERGCPPYAAANVGMV